MAKSFKINLLAFGIFLLQWLIFLTCRKVYLGQKLPKRSCVILFWHGRLALMPFAYRKMGIKGKKAYVMISHHKDGEIIARNIAFFGLDALRGSTSKGALALLKQSFKILDQGDDVIITPDGPRGPYHSVSDGSVMIALKKNTPLFLLNYEASSFWEFKSWDKMILPKPFSKITYRLSEEIKIQNLNLEEAKVLIKEKFDMISQIDKG
ncbi:lysophospholipid acyltransferase family protein [Campylobacter lari]|uniref:lysophospholipid acyltransferase family protein n=1 Tax=Campylobacter lari TaxID=201 RepID=UPI00156FF78B|nr:lysophospholipid acyltransferase family protein [Campylobacter lari]